MKLKLPAPFLSSIFSIALAGLAQAGEIEINNHSFELNEANTPLNNSNSSAIVDWTKSLAFAGVQDAAFLAKVPGAPTSWSDGNYGLVLVGGFSGGVRQETATNITADTTYTIQIDVAGVTNWQGFKIGIGLGDIAIETGAQATQKGGPVAHSMNYNFTNVASDLAPGSLTTELSNVDVTEGEWSTLTITFKTAKTVSGAVPLSINLQMGNHAPGSGENGGFLMFDNIRVTSTP